MTFWIVLAILALVAIVAVGIYNGLVVARQAYRNAFAQIDVQLTRRYDLIPNLVETAKAFMSHERGTLEAVVAARNAASSPCWRQATMVPPIVVSARTTMSQVFAEFM